MRKPETSHICPTNSCFRNLGGTFDQHLSFSCLTHHGVEESVCLFAPTRILTGMEKEITLKVDFKTLFLTYKILKG